MKASRIAAASIQAVSFMLIGSPAEAVIPTPIPGSIQSAPQNSWVQLNTNLFSDAWGPTELVPFNTKAIIEAWSSMAWDSVRGNLILWGGGHGNYTGNEVYLWKSGNKAWDRGSLASALVADPLVPLRFETVDGPMHSPISMHTYDGNIYLPRLDRFLTFGGPPYNTGGAGPNMYDNGILRNTGPYLWDPAKADPMKVGGSAGSHLISATYPAGAIQGGNMWQNRDSRPQGIPPGSDRPFGANFTAYASEAGKDVVYLSSGAGLWRYTIPDLNDPSQDQYQLAGINDNGLHPHGAGAYNPKRRLWVELRGSDFAFYELGNGPAPAIALVFNNRIVYASPADQGTFNFGSTVWPTIGDRYGLEYDRLRDRFLLWEGVNEIWELKAPADLATGSWVLTRLTPVSGAGGSPDRIADSVLADNGYYAWRGAAGKWKYIPDWDAFLGVYHPVDGDVWAYKPPPAQVFVDVPPGFWAKPSIEAIYFADVTTGCVLLPLTYCTNGNVTRAQMATFLERALKGSGYAPPAANGVFSDVPTNYWASGWIEALYADAITTGCTLSPLAFCPEQPVTRAQMAAFLLRAKYGAGFSPPPATGMFSDVPVSHWAARWIELLYNEGITTGCGSNPLRYCPEANVIRDQMAVFLQRTFRFQ